MCCNDGEFQYEYNTYNKNVQMFTMKFLNILFYKIFLREK